MAHVVVSVDNQSVFKRGSTKCLAAALEHDDCRIPGEGLRFTFGVLF